MAPTISVSPSGAMASNTPTPGSNTVDSTTPVNTPTPGSNTVDSTTPVPDGLAGEGTEEMDATDGRIKSEDIVKKLKESEDIGMFVFGFLFIVLLRTTIYMKEWIRLVT